MAVQQKSRHTLAEIDELLDKARSVSNQNLLYNWFWVPPVNQRGALEYTEPGYTIDGWHLRRGSIEILPGEGVLLIPPEGDSLRLDQHLHYTLAANGDQPTLCVSILVDWVLYAGTFKMPAPGEYTDLRFSILDSESNGYITFRYYKPEGDTMDDFRIHVGNGEPCCVQAVKLEVGSASSLSVNFDDTTLHSNAIKAPPDFGEELAKCQRYQLALDTSAVRFNSGRLTASTIDFIVPTPVTLREVPLLTQSDFRVYEVLSSGLYGSAASGFTFTAYLSSNGVCIRATKSGHGLTRAVLDVKAGSILDSNIY